MLQINKKRVRTLIFPGELGRASEGLLGENTWKKIAKEHLSENISTWWDLWSYSGGKCPRVLFHPDGDSKYFRFDGHKRCFHFRPRVLGSEKRFPTASDLCKDTLRTHCYHSLRKQTREECSVSASAIPVVILSGQNYTVTWLCDINKQAPVFQKMQTL